MTAAVGIEMSAEIEAGGRTGAGLGAGQCQAATVFTSSKGQSASWLSAANVTSAPAVSGTESFRSRWQAMIEGLETGPGAGLKTGLRAGQETGSGTGQGTAIRPRPGTGIEAESADENTDAGEGIGGTAEIFLLNIANRNFAAVLPNAAGATPQSNEATEQTNGALTGTTKATLSLPQNGVSELTVAVAPQVQSAATAQNSDTSGVAHAGHSVKSDKRESVSQRTNAEPQATTSNNGSFATPIAATVNPIVPAPVMQAQVQAQNLLSAPQSNLVDRVLSLDQEPGSSKGTAAESVTTVRNNAAGTAGIGARTGINPRAAAGNPAAATPGGSEDSETSGVQAFAAGDAGASDAKQQTGLPRSMWAQAEATQLESATSQHRTGSGNSLVDAAKANSGTYQETSLGAAGTSAFASQSQAATTAVDKSNLESARQPAEEATTRLAHRDSAGEAAQPAAVTVLAQQSGAGVEVSGLARIPAGAEGTANAMTERAGVTAGTAAGTTAGETFAAIDAGTAVGTPGWIHAGGQTAEAGFQDPALGWVGVRADVSGGNVHAALIPGSADAAQTLSGHLAGLNAYLAEQHTPVATLTLGAAGGGGIGTSAGQSMQQGSSQNAEQNTPTQSQSSFQPDMATVRAAAARGTETENGAFETVAHTGEMRGRHISVMA